MRVIFGVNEIIRISDRFVTLFFVRVFKTVFTQWKLSKGFKCYDLEDAKFSVVIDQGVSQQVLFSLVKTYGK